MAQIKSTDGFSKNLTDHAVAHVYHGFDDTISYNTFLTNVVKMQTFWSKKEVNRMLEKPTYNDDINALGFDTSLVRLNQDRMIILYWTFARMYLSVDIERLWMADYAGQIPNRGLWLAPEF